MFDCKPAITPMSTFIMIWIDPDGKDVNTSLYIGMFGYLMYLTASKTDIMCATSLCGRYQEPPKEYYIGAIK